MGRSTKEQLILFAEDTPVSRSAAPESASAKRTLATFGPRCSESFESAAPVGSLPRTLAVTFETVSTPWPHSWRVKASPSGRSLFQLTQSVRRTNENASGLWPTPLARDSHNRSGQAHRYLVQKRWNLQDCLAARGERGSLNPPWVEWLMGFPLGWTVLEPSETP